MGISVGGLASGIDVDRIVEQISEVERRPIEALKTKGEDYNVMLSAYGSMKKELAHLNTSLKDLQFASDFTNFKAVLENEELFSASASDYSAPGIYAVNITQTAQEQKLTSGAFSEEELVGEGTFTIQLGEGEAFEIEAGPEMTLSALSNAINASDSEVTSGVIFDGTSYFLTLTADKTGAANTINLSVTDADGSNGNDSGLSRLMDIEIPEENQDGTLDTSRPQSFTESKQAQDAIFDVDGVTGIHRETNTVDDVIKGVSLTLISAGDSGKLTVSRDTEPVIAKVEVFIEKFNNVMTFFHNSQKYDKDAKTQPTLFGDATATRINNNLSRVVGNMIQDVDSLSYLSDLGISMERVIDKDAEDAGKRFLDLDPAKFEAALTENPEDVVKFFTRNEKDKEGFATRMIDILGSFTDPASGLISISTNSLQTKIDGIDKQVYRMEDRQKSSEDRLRKQFQTLEGLVGQYKATGDQLTAQLAGLANLNRQVANG